MRRTCVTVVIGLVLAITACANKNTPSAAGGAAGQAAGSGGSSVTTTMTAQDLDALMKKIGPTYGSLNKNAAANLSAAATDGQQLAEHFGNVERFFAQHKKTDAVTWAQEARKYAAEAAGAAAANDAMKAQAAAKNILGSCKQCHGMYREGDQATGFRIKAGAIPGA